MQQLGTYEGISDQEITDGHGLEIVHAQFGTHAAAEVRLCVVIFDLRMSITQMLRDQIMGARSA